MKKVLIIGSGSIKIGEAGEFDYSGSQCIKALKEEGIRTILVNPNIATIQTSDYLADKVYFLPVTPEFVEKIINKERPDGILLSFGGQTALNTGIKLYEKGVFKKYNVNVLGTPIKAIADTEDRDLFIQKLKEINLKTPKGFAVTNVDEAMEAGKKIGFPLMLRGAYALGGMGSGVVYSGEELKEHVRRAFKFTDQLLIEEYLEGWKEVEYEVVRDCFDNCITVCNMENFDPMGIHTGESIVVAPSQTLTNEEYHMLREISIKVIRHLGIVGECNIQFALSADKKDYRIIEVNARLSRSSALASKATGYPLAFIAAKLALGYSLIDLENHVTKKTKSCFEPSLDYVVLKMPRWDLQKFGKVKNSIGSEMKSVGEVMAIGRNFEEVLQKAIRMAGTGMDGLVCNNIEIDNGFDELEMPTDKRIFSIASCLKKGISIDKINYLSKIDKWFLYKMKNIVEIEERLKGEELNRDLLLEAKKKGFSDLQIAKAIGGIEEEIWGKRKEMGIKPCIKQIDTLGAEFPAKTNYLYLTYNGEEDDADFSDKKKVIVLGSGAYRIGSSVEFDWCCVNSVLTLRKLGYKTIMINYNPETVSTDYDECDKLYFDELSFENVREIYEKENPEGVIVSVGGQIPNNLVMKLSKVGHVFGTSPDKIDNAENRYRFSQLLDELGIEQPEWDWFSNIKEAEKFCEGKYPVLVRPSYVLSGSAMSVVFNKCDLEKYLEKASGISREYPVVISKFITEAKEIEVDAVADRGELVTWAISEHIENAGVHSGDATMVFPPKKVYLETVKKIEDISQKIANALEITGPFNIQFIAKDNKVGVIECNLRASRSFPFVSKVSKVNFIDLATRVMMGEKVDWIGGVMDLKYVGVKAPQFSFARLKGADPILGVEMASTGEVACLGGDLCDAFLKSMISAGYKLPQKNIFISVGDKDRYELLEPLIKLKELGYNLLATEHTSEFLKKIGIESERLYKIHENKEPNVSDYIMDNKIDLVINIPKDYTEKELEDEYIIRRTAVDFSVPLITNLQLAKLFLNSLIEKKGRDFDIREWNEY